MTGLRKLAFFCSGIIVNKMYVNPGILDFDGDGNNVIFVREYVKLRRF